MRRALLFLPLLFACSKSEVPPDNAAAGPPALTEADVAGNWTGTAMPEGSDSVVARWTQRCGAGSCLGHTEGATDSVPSTYTLAGDSAMGRSSAYTDVVVPGAKVVDSWVLRISSGNVTGTGILRLADKPDSVVFRYHFRGSRVP